MELDIPFIGSAPTNVLAVKQSREECLSPRLTHTPLIKLLHHVHACFPPQLNHYVWQTMSMSDLQSREMGKIGAMRQMACTILLQSSRLETSGHLAEDGDVRG